MYAFFNGKLAQKNPHEIVIDISGIGYLLFIPASLYPNLPNLGETVFVHTSWVVREMSQALYAFASSDERDLFEVLLNISGIGPKTALAIIGHIDILSLEEAVLTGNTRKLTQVPGIGKKTAERLLIDLKGKIKITSNFTQKISGSSKIQDALNALLHLGCSQQQAEKAIKQAADELSEECDLASLISAALKYQ